MNRARKFGVPTPTLYLIDDVQRRIYMEYLGQQAMTVKEFLYQLKSFDHPILEELIEKIGGYLAILHSNDQIHGDLTTSNMMIKPNFQQEISQIAGPMTAQQIVEAGTIGDVFDKILLKYKEKGQKSLQILAKYNDVEKRGRKRECFG
ncbi:bud32_dicdi ame: full=probable serine threonine-protein kinase bud32 homolog [Stylonychia lemnae]|uniref:non-specific serine/threonine protein kinase n=1 Tax=Stylonychia lemnae TaxID=5949 RepID=A0A078AEW0_STYLE|nr:bud32_dicdi ame: full=probable serine threonine-protein kinase bud32 homolog [Stylonychia lemnae]|eukprot:CDW80047.1 bud32_dicdi ame: full=probable serine threonine-protein kinase bud32 homolog [Stylonychia lemnae]